ncbi:TRAP transporter fused permease subunit [Elioraea sp.]|uniref:TRAP transporter permease n=1 Tax=Elioraea sp. TaxID=2185103 RepID=UPI0025C1CC4F|nr:TRAP transporter fused permease subunit [Elioraea sp.]
MLALALGWESDRNATLFAFLGAVLALGFLTVTGNGVRQTGRSWFANTLAALSIAACGYFVWMAPVHALRWPMVSPLSTTDMTAAILLCLLVLEATRRTIGLTLCILVAGFLAYAVWGHHVPGSFSHRPLSITEIVDHLAFTTNGLIGPALSVAAFLVFVFVLFGAMLDRLGGGDFFHDLASALVGRQAGGPAKVAVVSSAMYGTISGSPTADVVTTGSLTIPMMKRLGYSPAYAGGVEAAASAGGAILPPVMGSAAFLMSDFTGIPYADIALSAITTALLYYVAVFYQVHARAVLDGLGGFAEAGPRIALVLRRGWWFLIPIGAMVWLVVSADRPVYGGGIAVVLIAALAFVMIREPVRVIGLLLDAAQDGARRAAPVGIACGVAGLVVGTLTITDLSGKFSSLLFGFAPDQLLFVMMITAGVTLLLGMGMPTPAVYVLAAVLAAPAMISLGVPVLAAHLFVVYYASMSAITPPVAVAAFAAASIAQADPIRIGFIACRLAIVAFVLPFCFVFRPALLLAGDPLDAIWAVAVTFIGVIALAAGLEGWLGRRLTAGQRALLVGAGLTLVAPDWRADAAGLLLFALAAAWVRFRREPVAA